MAKISVDLVISAIGQYLDTYLQRNFVELNAIDDIKISDNQVEVSLVLGYPIDSIRQELSRKIAFLIEEAVNISDVKVRIESRINTLLPQHQLLHTLKEIKNIVAISSSKGGVGKSTTAVNLALALAQEGASVGILDADIYGPSQPMMLGVSKGTKPAIQENKYFVPIVRYGIKSMSIGYLLHDDSALAWRGPMASGALTQMLTQTLWGDLDYLVIDLPPGTGDIQLSLSQQAPISGSVVITTPQKIALQDVQKGIAMFKKVDIPVLGIIENMSIHLCQNCGHEEYIFGSGGGEKLATDCGTRLLGSLPLVSQIGKHADNGVPIVAGDPEGTISQIYGALARNVAAQLWSHYSTKIPAPEIILSND